MDETVLGMYEFGNDTLVDPFQEGAGGDVFMHEYTHKMISAFSSMGLLLMMLKKASLLDRSRQWLYEELVKLVREVQEITATNVEHYHIYETRGGGAFEDALRLLGKNKEYLRYFNRLYDLRRGVRSEEDAAGLIPVLVLLAVWSMHLDFAEFPLWKFRSSGELADFWKKPGMRERYHPARRFHILTDYFLRNDRREETLKSLRQVLDGTCEGNPTESCFQTVCKIYRGSGSLEGIRRRIRTISLDLANVEIAEGVESTRLSAYPMNLNDSRYRRRYVLSNVAACRRKLLGDPDLLLIFQHVMGGLEKHTMLACAGGGPEISLCHYTEADLPELLSLPNQIVFTRGKLIQKLRPMLRQCRRKPYILMDSGMAGNLRFIYQEFAEGACTFMPCGRYAALLIYDAWHALFQPVFWEALPDALRLLKVHGIGYREYGVSGYYKDPALELLAGYSRDVASDARNMFRMMEERALNGGTGAGPA